MSTNLETVDIFQVLLVMETIEIERRYGYSPPRFLDSFELIFYLEN